MGPTRAMGTFLRVWRSEWLGISREQLAALVRGVSPKARGVTRAVVRSWEAGQPPAGTGELEALLQTMRRHRLSQPGFDQSRLAIYAACLDRRYPEEFECAEFAERPDVDEAALDLYWSLSSAPF